MENPLAPWRDLALVWLILWVMLFVAVPGVVFYFAQKYLRRFRRWLRLPLLNTQVWALRIQQGTSRVSARVADIPIAMSSLGTRLYVTTRSVLQVILGR